MFLLHRSREFHRVAGCTGAQRSAGTAHEQHGAERRLAILGNQVDSFLQFRRQWRRLWHQIVVQDVKSVLLSGGGHHQEGQARPGAFAGVPVAKDGQRVLDVGAAPAKPRVGNLKIATRRGPASDDLDSRLLPVDHLAGLMLRHDTCDVVVNHDHLVHKPFPL